MNRFILLSCLLCGSIGCVTKTDSQVSAPAANVTAGGGKVSNAEREEILKRIKSAEQSMKELEEKSRQADPELSKAAMKDWMQQFNDWHRNQAELVRINEKLGISEPPKAPSDGERSDLESQIAATAAIVLSLNQKMAFASGTDKADYKLQALFNEKRIQLWQHQLDGKLP